MEYVREEIYPIWQGLDLYLTKGKALTGNSQSFNQLKLNLREYELCFNERRCENLDMVGNYRPYYFNRENFGLYLYTEMFGMYLLSILRQTTLTLREAHTLALDSVLTHVSFHYLIERYCILIDDVKKAKGGLYPAYKKKIYSQTWGTPGCFEETLANAFVAMAHPHWTNKQKDYLQSLYARQREGYSQAHNLNLKHYREFCRVLEEQLKIQRQESGKEPPEDIPVQNIPALFEFIQTNLPFRFIGLPVYLVNDCGRPEEFRQIVELLFPRI